MIAPIRTDAIAPTGSVPSLPGGAVIPVPVADEAMSLMAGSIGAPPPRLPGPGDQDAQARRPNDAGLARALRDETA